MWVRRTPGKHARVQRTPEVSVAQVKVGDTAVVKSGWYAEAVGSVLSVEGVMVGVHIDGDIRRFLASDLMTFQFAIGQKVWYSQGSSRRAGVIDHIGTKDGRVTLGVELEGGDNRWGYVNQFEAR